MFYHITPALPLVSRAATLLFPGAFHLRAAFKTRQLTFQLAGRTSWCLLLRPPCRALCRLVCARPHRLPPLSADASLSLSPAPRALLVLGFCGASTPLEAPERDLLTALTQALVTVIEIDRVNQSNERPIQRRGKSWMLAEARQAVFLPPCFSLKVWIIRTISGY